MPYVKCPKCELIGYSTAAHATPACCPHCGAALPLSRRAVVAVVRHQRLLSDPVMPLRRSLGGAGDVTPDRSEVIE